MMRLRDLLAILLQMYSQATPALFQAFQIKVAQLIRVSALQTWTFAN